MSSQTAVLSTDLQGYLPLVARGKVRELYSLDDSSLLFVTTDRISAYDVIMKNGIPNKGALLTTLSEFWFNLFKSWVPDLRTHYIQSTIPAAVIEKIPRELQSQIQGRSMEVRKLKVFPIEAIVRGYITGSAWKEYKEKGTVHGMQVSGPGGKPLQESEKFETPLFTPSTKAEVGDKDENIHPDRAAELVGKQYADTIKNLSLEIYTRARDYALERGIILADTKFEFGLDEATDEVVLVDEVFTVSTAPLHPLGKR